MSRLTIQYVREFLNSSCCCILKYLFRVHNQFEELLFVYVIKWSRVKFGVNYHKQIFQRLSSKGECNLWSEFTSAYSFQFTLEIIMLIMYMQFNVTFLHPISASCIQIRLSALFWVKWLALNQSACWKVCMYVIISKTTPI